MDAWGSWRTRGTRPATGCPWDVRSGVATESNTCPGARIYVAEAGKSGPFVEE